MSTEQMQMPMNLGRAIPGSRTELLPYSQPRPPYECFLYRGGGFRGFDLNLMETIAHTLGSGCNEPTLFPVSPAAPRSLSLVCGGTEPSGEAAGPGAGAAGDGVKMNEAGTSEPHTNPKIIPQATGSVNTWDLLTHAGDSVWNVPEGNGPRTPHRL